MLTLLRGTIAFILYASWIVGIALVILIFVLFITLLPVHRWRKAGWRFLQNFLLWWHDGNSIIMRLTTGDKISITGDQSLLNPLGTYIMMANHQSWIDILILGNVFNRKAPPLKFFMKKQLLWSLPFAGLVCYLLNFPFMERHTPAQIRKKPSLKGKDIQTIKNACQKLKKYPVTLINFVEGTRFTQEKKSQQQSPFQHLLKPKAAGLAMVVGELSPILASIINVTINYAPTEVSFWHFACGQFDRISVNFDILPVRPELIGDYENDRHFRTHFQRWLNKLWQDKDDFLSTANVRKFTHKKLRLVTRKSPMAWQQAETVKTLLMQYIPTIEIEIIGITTQGDKNTQISLIDIGGKTLFVKELQQALLANEADIAVHSVKDMSAFDHPELCLAAVCKRDDPRDTFISNHYASLTDLPKGAIIGTSSPRRECLLKALRQDLQFKTLRGNANTRLAKLDANEYDAIILGAAGLTRIEQQKRITEYLDIDHFIPAIAQGTIGIECRRHDDAILELLKLLNDTNTHYAITAERAVNQKLGGNCYTPIAAYAEVQENIIYLRAMIGDTQGNLIRDHIRDNVTQAQALGEKMAEKLLQQGAEKFLRQKHE